MAEIQNTIKSYVDHANKCRRKISDGDLLAFVGMLETGEAELTDFVAVGGQSLADDVHLLASRFGVLQHRRDGS
tara:strand:- start:391 stop:612 length:222 start_codon:yes stop_codon:yes gene_type:complete